MLLVVVVGDGDGRQQQVTTWATKHNACDDPQAEKGVRLERWSAEGAVCCPGLLHPLSSLHTLLCVCFLLFASVRNSVGGCGCVENGTDPVDRHTNFLVVVFSLLHIL